MTLERGPPLSQARHRRADSSCGEEVQANFSARGHQTNMVVPPQPGHAPRLHTLRAWQGGKCLQYQPKSPGHLRGAPVTTRSHCSKGRGQPRTSVWLATKAVSPSRLSCMMWPRTRATRLASPKFWLAPPPASAEGKYSPGRVVNPGLLAILSSQAVVLVLLFLCRKDA